MIAKFLADGTLGNSAMYEGGGLVGIGTTSPLLALDVNGSATDWGQIRAANSNQDTWVQLWSGYSAGGNPPAIIWSNQPAAHDLRFGFGGPLGDPFTEVMRIKGNGNVGIGTATPTSKLEIIGQDALAITGFEPVFTLRDAGHGNKKAYVQNVDGNVALTTNSQAALVVKDISGNVGIGTTDPVAKLHVEDFVDTAAYFKTIFPNAVAGWFAGGYVRVDNLQSGFGDTPLCWDGLRHNLSHCSSSIRYKEQVSSLGSGLELVHKLRPVTFRWKETGTPDLGLIAEEVNSVEPLLVTHNAQGEIEGVKYDRLAAVLINAVKEQQTEIRQQREQLDQQQKMIQSLQQIVCTDHPQAQACQ